jgi:hypothetical protein
MQHVLSHHHWPQLTLPHYSQLFFSEVNLMPVAAYMKRDADEGGSTAHAAPTVFSPFQKLRRISRRTLQLPLDNGTKSSLVCSLP